MIPQNVKLTAIQKHQTAVTRQSPFSGTVNSITVDLPRDVLAEWFASPPAATIQEHFPALNADEREFLMTGITAEEWDQMFNGSE